jgi:hypothetical protein
MPTLNFLAVFLTTNPIVLILITLGYLGAAIGGPLAYLFCGTRVLFAWAFDRIIPTKVAAVDRRFRSPWVAVILMTISAEIHVLLTLYTGVFAYFETIIFAWWIAMMIVGIACMIFPYRRKDIFEASPSIVKAKLGGVPLVSILGFITLISSIYLAWVVMEPHLTGVVPLPMGFAVGVIVFFIAVFAVYWVSRSIAKARGIPMELSFKEVPPSNPSFSSTSKGGRMNGKNAGFFTTDVHGAERVFKKFLNAGKIYKANVIILGGDITGKMIVPIVEQPDGSFTARFLDMDYSLKPDDLGPFEEKVRAIGYYTYRTDPREFEELRADEAKLDELFTRLMVETMQKWVQLAEERLKGTNIKCFISPGNDDRYCIDPLLENSDHIICPEGKVVNIDDQHEMMSTGHTNITPWKCPRDIPEDELHRLIEEMTSKVKNMKNCIFNFHCPPFDTTIDYAPKLNENLQPTTGRDGKYEMIPAGSTAVRGAIEKHQPLLGLHGHIHEGRGVFKLGRTLCINPSSEYTEGVLRGVVIDLSDKGVGYLLTSG